MRRPARLNLKLATGVALCVALGVVAVVATAPSLLPGDRGESTAESLRAATNSARFRANLPALTSDPGLERAARAYAERLARGELFQHQGGDGSTLVTRAESAGYHGWLVLGENLAMGQGAPAADEVVAAWLASPGHRANLLSDEARETGAGCYLEGRGGRFWCVQLFGARGGGRVGIVSERRPASPLVGGWMATPGRGAVTGTGVASIDAAVMITSTCVSCPEATFTCLTEIDPTPLTG